LSSRVVKEIKIVSLPKKMDYLIGEIPDFDGLTIKRIYTDDFEEMISDYGIQWNTFTAGKSSVTVVVEGFDDSFDITVKDTLIDTGLPVVYINTENGQIIDSKDNYVKANMIIKDGGIIVNENTLRIRGRGNATWSYPKKPYKIKLDDKADILGMGDDKDWVLLANYCDKTLLRTGIAFKLSELLDFPWTPKARFVELVLNGEYIGNYQIVEGIKQDSKRVNIPKNGFIIERDGYYLQEPIWFETDKNYGYSFKNPDTDDLTDEQYNYIAGYMNDFETVLYSAAFKNSENGYQQYIDVDSFSRWYLFQQIIANLDTNVYLYKSDSTNSSKIFMGPVWDFEWSMGIGWYDGPRPRPADYWVWENNFYFDQLLKDDIFIERMQDMWTQNHAQIKQSILQYIGDETNTIMESQKLNFRRWDILNTRVSVGGVPLGGFEAEVACDIQFFINHMDWLATVIDDLL
jgi:spore coat protein CotH